MSHSASARPEAETVTGPTPDHDVDTAATGGTTDPVPPVFRDAIAATLETFIARKEAELAPVGGGLAPLFDAARRAVSGGKRLRPAFAYWGWRAAGKSERALAKITEAVAAIELVHASALVHDDVMDASLTRRGFPAAHRELAGLADEAPAPAAARFGRSAAILLGDMLLSWSDEMLDHSGFRPRTVRRGRIYFDRLRTEVVAGQFLDVLAQTHQRNSVSDAMRVVRYKSAKYTVERPLQFGAALAKGDDALLSALSLYGVPLGEAFQLRDDVLGVFGRADVTGKPSGDDIREGKRTLLVTRAFGKADPEQRTVLEATVGNADVDAAGIAAAQGVLRDTGALAAVEIVISELTAASLMALQRAPIADDEVRTALVAMSDRATNREV